MEFYFIYLLELKSILCGMCYPFMNVVIIIFETISQLSCMKQFYFIFNFMRWLYSKVIGEGKNAKCISKY
jgi:hypothetical protein